MNKKANPDDRRDNVDRIQFNIDNTIKNYRETEDMIAATDDEKTRKELIEKNKRRKESLQGMKEEIKDEAIAKEQGYK
ncbi:MAG TPA: small acid-soluble spore protein Tlp [Tissierellaceae bacterium]|nr:small acid-soluble spore protein Tlp [Tissierellaceae bacterium]